MAGTPPRDPTTPRWVKVFAIVAAVLVALFFILMFTRGPGGRHGPQRHMFFEQFDSTPYANVAQRS